VTDGSKQDNGARQALPRISWRAGESTHGFRDLATEIPVALVHDAVVTAIRAATPADLEDLAVGFTLSEGLADMLEQIQSVEIAAADKGTEARVWLDAPRSAQLTALRARAAGPTGAGPAGAEALTEAFRPPVRVVGQLELDAEDVQIGLRAFREALTLALEGSGHGAGFWRPSHGLIAAREDVDAQNALDKLAGAVARRGLRRPGMVMTTAPLTAELVRRAARISAPILASAGPPTAPAVRAAEAADMTLLALARGDGFELYTRPDRIVGR